MVNGVKAVRVLMVIRRKGHNLYTCIVQRLAIDNRVNDDHVAMHAVIIERNKWLTVTPLRNFMDSVG